MKFDFSLLEWEKKTVPEAEAIWNQEYNDIASHAAMPIFHWPWHDYGPTVWDTNGKSPYTKEMFTNLIAKAYNAGAEFVTAKDLSDRIKTFEQAKVFTSNSGNTITAKVEPATSTSVGNFGLNVETGQQIQSVANWYAYDADTVFLPKAGGEFTINLGTTPEDVTRIIDLPMRSTLESVTGDGQNLDYTFTGAGTVKLDLKIPQGQEVITTGADSTTLNGDILEMVFQNEGQHTAKVSFGVAQDQPPTVATPIDDVTAEEDDPSQTIDLSNVFDDVDNDNSLIVKTVKTNSNDTLVTSSITDNTLTLNYLKDQSGTAEISVEATSNGQTVTDSFTVNVNSVDDAPTLASPIADVTVDKNAPQSTIDLADVFDDIDDDKTAITKTLLTNSNIELVTPSINGNTLTLEYLNNQFGTANITVRGTSNGKTVDDSFIINVNDSVVTEPNDPVVTEPNDPVVTNPNDPVVTNPNDPVVTDPNTAFNVINVTNANSNVKGTTGNDQINGLAGNETLAGQKGNDNLNGGDGNDSLKGGDGNDTLKGDGGNDKLDGQLGDDVLNGDIGNDTLGGGAGNDTLSAGADNDKLNGDAGDDSLSGDGGNDTLNGGNGDDILIGVDSTSATPGKGEIDVLTGGRNKDQFVLGDSSQAYYKDSGSDDYALISDFKLNDDIIQLYGNASNYRLQPRYSLSGNNGTALWLKTSDTEEELIAIVKGNKTLDLTNSKAFSFI